MIDILDEEQIQVMVDLETLSLEPHAAIVSIGATKFTIKDGIHETFTVNVDPMDGKQLGLHLDAETIEWWKKQPKEISDLWKVYPLPVKEAMTRFANWFGGRRLPIWANSPSADCVWLKESMKVTNTPCPWHYRDECDYRTFSKVFIVDFEWGDKAHSSLDDAINQTNHLLKMMKT
jgi:exodeoxyribonuclease VIII